MNKFEEVYRDMILEEAKTNQKLSKAQIKNIIKETLSQKCENTKFKSGVLNAQGKSTNGYFEFINKKNKQLFVRFWTDKNQLNAEGVNVEVLENVSKDPSKQELKFKYHYEGSLNGNNALNEAKFKKQMKRILNKYF